MLNIKVVTWALATPESLHMHRFLEQILPGFKWISWANFFIGAVGSVLWGAYIGLAYVPIYNFFAGRFSRRSYIMPMAHKSSLVSAFELQHPSI